MQYSKITSSTCKKYTTLSKKVRDFPVPGRDVTNQTFPWPGIFQLFPTKESLVSDIPTGDG